MTEHVAGCNTDRTILNLRHFIKEDRQSDAGTENLNKNS
jgi:hypothetical protein